MEKDKLIIGNMKMYMTSRDVKEYLQNLTLTTKDNNLVLCPTSIFVPYFLGHQFKVGVQNISATSLGAYTGELSAIQASSLGVTYAIIGHSERRMYFDEINEQIHQKIKHALECNITPVVCIGETLDDYTNKKTLPILKKQIIDCLTGLSLDEIEKIIIAYEPIWAIGTGKIPNNIEIESIVDEIKKILKEVFKSYQNKVLYGGSVSSNNINELEQISNLDGYLIGSASIKVEEMKKILEVVNQ